jgi:hypothetical protein
LVAVVAVGLTAAGCGSEKAAQPSGSDRAESTQAALTPADTRSGLTETQFEELEQMLVAMLPLDDLDEDVGTEKADRVLEDITAACSGVDRKDPLLEAMVDGCEEAVERLAATDTDCDSADECGEAMLDLADMLEDIARTVRENRPTIARAVSDRRCREVMSDSEELAVFEQAVPLYRRMAAAISSGDQAAYRATMRDLEPIEARSDALPSGRDRLRQFRRVCRP